MGLSSLNHLYREVVLDHSQHPRHHGALPAATDHLELRNPTCGDVIDVQAQIKDGVITDLAFDGSGCTISQASASMMTTVLIGQPVDHARELILNFSNLITGKKLMQKWRTSWKMPRSLVPWLNFQRGSSVRHSPGTP